MANGTYEAYSPPGDVFEINAEPRETVKVKLVGVMYDVYPPKMSFTLAIASRADQFEDSPSETQKMVDEWVRAAFGDEAGDSVMDRLEDPADDLDVMHIIKLMEHMVEVQTENPTSSPSDSAGSPSRTGRTSTASRSRRASQR